ncbi:MAG: hypothetical protein MOGMAGMI_01445 [Candidatus Omnitrophica bacterium]|nr:hypothetical protein [Candidatus Omnitrophota bacterium]
MLRRPLPAVALLVLSVLSAWSVHASEIFEDSFVEFIVPEGCVVDSSRPGDYRVLAAYDEQAPLVRIRLDVSGLSAEDLSRTGDVVERALRQGSHPDLVIESREKSSIGERAALSYTYSYLIEGDSTRHVRARALYAARSGRLVEVLCAAPVEEFDARWESAREVFESLRLY